MGASGGRIGGNGAGLYMRCPQNNNKKKKTLLMPLTDTSVRNAKPKGAKPRKMFDGGGLYLEISPKGKKGWRFKYRYAGKEKRISFGIYPDVTLKYAREQKEQARAPFSSTILYL